MAAIRQPSFASGELAPSLWGRTDSPRYATGARLLSNFFVSKQGNAVSRPGAQYLLQASKTLSTVNIGTIQAPNFVKYTAGAGVRLIGFNWSDTSTDQNAVLEFGEQSIRVISNGAYVATVSGSIPYHRADLWKIRVAQSLDVMYVACPGYAPAKISRTSSTSWAWAVVDFTRAGPLDIDTTTPVGARVDESTFGKVDPGHPARPWAWQATEIRRDARGIIFESAPVRCNGLLWYGTAWNALVTYKVGTVVNSGSTGSTPYHQCLVGGTTSANPPPTSGTNAHWRQVDVYDSGLSYGLGDWIINGATYLQRLNYSLGTAGLPPSNTSAWGPIGTQWQGDDFSNTDVLTPLYPDRPVTIALPSPLVDSNFVTFRVYRGRAGVFGYVGDSIGTSFVDDGKEPDLTQPPPQGSNPFVVNDGGVTRTETPISVAFFQDRLCFGGTLQRPNIVLASAVGDYENFDERLVPEDSDALLFGLTSRKREYVRALRGGSMLFALTDAGIWAISGGQDAPLTPTSVDARVHVEIGTDWPEPLAVAGELLWVRNKGTGVRRVGFDFESGKFQSQDLSIASEHLVLGHKIVDWAYAEDPWSLVWLVRDDGVLLSLTYAPDDNLWAWAEHGVLGPGGNAAVVQSVCSIVEGDEDVLYIAVQGPDVALWDMNTTYNTGDLAKMSVGGVIGVYASAQDNNLNHPDPTQTAWWIQVQNTNSASWILRLSTRQEVAGKTPACLDSYLEYDNPATGGTVFFSGVSHLATVPVSAVGVDANGVESKLGSATVGSNGVVGFIVPTGTSKVYIGLPYNCDLELLDLAQAKDKQKSVSQAALEIRALGAPQVGTDSANLKSWAGYAPQVVANNPPNYYLVKVPVVSTWDNYGRVYLRQSDPLPITVLGVTREVDLGAR